ncbi:diguanylate cyclase domain-containing protein [Marinobacter arenosus]|uniref:diguanylate cyclase domain-containing protein n=1 Tax=Marinobacter arenosus TaxID=2856822 RepID=UPI001C4C09CD|nr:diguanylate cyclase [Marinobacter arenosus]MBW0147335.1 diguanylate cyclase [Marinobacter arenosus]
MLNSFRAVHLSPTPTRNGQRKRLKPKSTRNKANVKDETALAYAMLDFVGDGVMATDTCANITYMNTAAETLTGFSRQEALGRPLEEVFRVIDVTTRMTRANLAQHVLEIGTPVELHNSALLKARDGRELAIEDAASPLRNAKGEITGALVKFHDSRYSAETTARMAYMAQHDSLTGLLNRYAFEERFKQAAALAQRHEKKMVMLFIDLNNFKEVNDTLGHAVGDEILQALGLRLLGCVRATDHVCRHGGDEFVLLLSDLAEHEQAFAVVDKVRESAAELLRQQGHWETLTVSVGISLFPNDGETLEALLPHADAAMYRVKTDAKRGLPDLKP